MFEAPSCFSAPPRSADLVGTYENHWRIPTLPGNESCKEPKRKEPAGILNIFLSPLEFFIP